MHQQAGCGQQGYDGAPLEDKALLFRRRDWDIDTGEMNDGFLGRIEHDMDYSWWEDSPRRQMSR